MKICVYGLHHLGSVTAACLAEAGFTTIGLDETIIIESLKKGLPPIYEPGLAELITAGLNSGKLSFTADAKTALTDLNILWICFDTPVNDDDQADVNFVKQQIINIFPFLQSHTVILISSQMPVGSVKELEQDFAKVAANRQINFAYSPENLRLGRAIDVFKSPERIVIGIRNTQTQIVLQAILEKFSKNLIWIAVESAEMTKHAINAFLAMSVTFINEIANLCEYTGADIEEVEIGLRSEARIGQKAYVKAGASFAGGTLARDVKYLQTFAKQYDSNAHLINGILHSNQAHKNWIMRQLKQQLGSLKEKIITILGLSYKPGTDSLRRSAAIELCQWLIEQGAYVQAFDPKVKNIPLELGANIKLTESCEQSLLNADSLVIATEWPEFKELSSTLLKKQMRLPLVIDQNCFLRQNFFNDQEIKYITIGKPL